MVTILIATCPRTGGIMYLCVEWALELSMTDAETMWEMGDAYVFDCR